MTKLRLLGIVGALLIGAAVSTCQGQLPLSDRAQAAQVDRLLGLLENTEQDAQQGLFLQNTTEVARNDVRIKLRDAKSATLRLRTDLYDRAALNRLYSVYQSLLSLNIASVDRDYLAALNDELKNTVGTIAQLQGTTFDGLERILYVKEFNAELLPFTVRKETGGEGWVLGSYKDNHFAVIAGLASKSWLFSPRLNLANVRNPTLSLRQSINSNGDSFSELVSILISNDFNGKNLRTAHWDKLTFENMPDGRSFDATDTEDLSLSKYVGQSVVVGFRYDSTLSSRAVTWQLSRVGVKGIGQVVSTSLDGKGDSDAARETLYKKTFNLAGAELTPFVPLSISNSWKMGSDQAKKFFALAETLVNSDGQIQALDTWLFSPYFDLQQVLKPALVLQQAIVGRNFRAAVSVLISSDFTGQNPEKAHWDKLTIQSLPLGDKLVTTESELIDLRAYEGKKIVIAFRAKSLEDQVQSLSWRLENVRILGQGRIGLEDMKLKPMAELAP